MVVPSCTSPMSRTGNTGLTGHRDGGFPVLPICKCGGSFPTSQGCCEASLVTGCDALRITGTEVRAGRVGHWSTEGVTKMLLRKSRTLRPLSRCGAGPVLPSDTRSGHWCLPYALRAPPSTPWFYSLLYLTWGEEEDGAGGGWRKAMEERAGSSMAEL